MKRVDHFRESVFGDPDLTAIEKLVLVAMTHWMDHQTLGNCRPGHARIAGRTSLAPRTVRRTIHSVIAKGWLVEERRGSSCKGKQREASVYCGTIPDHGQRVPSTTDTESRDYGHRGHPPSQGPGAPNRADALGPPNNTSRSNGRHAKGCTCYRCYHRQSQAHGLQADPRYS